MFRCSRRRGLYPQLFLQPLSEPVGSPEGLVFVGGWDEVRRFNDNEDDLGSLSAKLRPALGDRDMGWEGSPVAGSGSARGQADAGSVSAGSVPAPVMCAQEATGSAAGEIEIDQVDVDDGEGAAGCGYGAGHDVEAAAAGRANGEGGWEGDPPPVDSAEAWESVRTELGEEFFHNMVSGEVSWTKPASLGGSDWQRFLTDDGRPYFFNRVTNETVWERPEGVDV